MRTEAITVAQPCSWSFDWQEVTRGILSMSAGAAVTDHSTVDWVA